MPYHRSFIVLLIVVFVLVLTSWAIPRAQAAGPFFCTAAEASDGDGSASHPWACGTSDQFQTAVTRVCRAGGGALYFIFPDGYIEYTVAPDCTAQAGPPQNGLPPNTGTSLPPPWLLAAGSVLGLVLIGLGARLTTRAPMA